MSHSKTNHALYQVDNNDRNNRKIANLNRKTVLQT